MYGPLIVFRNFFTELQPHPGVAQRETVDASSTRYVHGILIVRRIQFYFPGEGRSTVEKNVSVPRRSDAI